MNLKETIVADMKEAMRGKETVRLETIRLLRAAIQRKEVDDRVDLDNDGVLQVIQKMVKQSTDAAEQFLKGNRRDLADRENAHISILQSYLPEQLGDDEIEKIITQSIEKADASGMKDMGKVMAAVKSEIRGRADMGAVSARVKSLLS